MLILSSKISTWMTTILTSIKSLNFNYNYLRTWILTSSSSVHKFSRCLIRDSSAETRWSKIGAMSIPTEMQTKWTLTQMQKVVKDQDKWWTISWKTINHAWITRHLRCSRRLRNWWGSGESVAKEQWFWSINKNRKRLGKRRRQIRTCRQLRDTRNLKEAVIDHFTIISQNP